MRIAVLMTVYNRKEKTLKCLQALQQTWGIHSKRIHLDVFLTDDASTDGTAEAVRAADFQFPVHILEGTGQLFWNGGMILAWKAAINQGGYNGYLWLNNDTYLLPAFWEDLLTADAFSLSHYGKKGIYVGSTQGTADGSYTYGGFNYISKFTLLDRFVIPDGLSFQECEASHGNITYVSSDVVDAQGIFCEQYFHGGTDHDYTYLAHKAGWPVLVLPHYSAICENDHPQDGGRSVFFAKPLKERWNDTFRSGGRSALRNTLLFNKRCFPYRYPFVLFSVFAKVVFPKLYYRLYLLMRGAKYRTW